MMFEQQFVFSLVVFLFTCGNFTLSFTVFSTFVSDFFRNVFPYSLIVRSRSVFLFNL